LALFIENKKSKRFDQPVSPLIGGQISHTRELRNFIYYFLLTAISGGQLRL
jgi:hypothetical protein